jgi:hypothetical protein
MSPRRWGISGPGLVKVPEKVNFKETRFILAFGFSPWSPGSIAFRTVSRQNIMVAGVCEGGRRRLLTSW